MHNVKGSYRCIVRSTSNHISTTDQYQVSLPPHIWKNMKWKLNEPIRATIDKENGCIILQKEEKND